MVRLALVTSVTCTPPSGPPVRFHSSQASVLPKIASPASAASRTPSTFSRIHWILPPEKYVAGGQPGLPPDDVAAAVAVERLGDAVGAGVLPDDRVVVGPAGPPVPDHRGLALVGDAERGEVGAGQALAAQRGLDHRAGALPDLDGVVLDPAGLRHDLLVLELVPGDLVAAVVEDHEAGAGGALVDRADEVSHELFSLLVGQGSGWSSVGVLAARGRLARRSGSRPTSPGSSSVRHEPARSAACRRPLRSARR